MRTFDRHIFILLLALLLSACGSSKKTIYFQGIDEVNMEAMVQEYQVRIMPNDNLHITVSSLKSEQSEIFNKLPNTLNMNQEAMNIMGYLVDSEGFINFPIIGKIKLAGMTKLEAVAHMTELVSHYIADPIVNIRLLNYKITVLGEVSRPGTYSIKDEKVTILEALGLAGDMTIYGKRANVLVFRETDGNKQFHRLDMTSPEIFTSDFFYLQQNDVVYVQPNRARAGSSNYNQNLSIGISAVSLLLTVINLIL